MSNRGNDRPGSRVKARAESRGVPAFVFGAIVAAGLLAVAILAGCGGDSATDSSELEHPMGADELVLRVEEAGGFLPVELALGQVPQFSLYGEGLVITPGPQILIFPAPALPNLQSATVSESEIQDILSQAQEAGLLDEGVDYGEPPIADAPTTTFTVNADGTSVTTSVYALGMEPPSDGGNGLTPEQIEARQQLQQFRQAVASVGGIEGAEVTWEPYEFTALAVFARPATPADIEGQDVEPNRLEWPLGDLASAGEEYEAGFRRIVVSGDDLDQLRPLLDQANELTLWESGGELYRLALRPLLPDEMADGTTSSS